MLKVLTLLPLICMMTAGDGTQGGNGDQGGQGGQGEAPDLTKTPEFAAALKTAVDREVAGLKANRQSFQDQLAKTQEQLAKYKGIDPEAAQALLARFESEEEKQLLQQGNLEGIVDRRVDKMRAKFDADMSEKDKTLQASLDRQQKLEQRAIAAEITKAASEAGAIPTALTDFVQRAQGSFALTEKGDVVAVDSEGNQLFDVDGKTPLSAKAWAESLQADAPHLFSKPNSGGAAGGQGERTAGKVDGTAAEREAYFKQRYNLNS